jgi:hypothetical protein
MEINYELIIKYLCKKPHTSSTIKPDESTFTTQKNIFNYSTNFPDKFKNILQGKFYRYGVTTCDHDSNNISFWTSLLTIIDKNFVIPYMSDELSLVNNFKNQLVDKYSKSKLSSFLKSLDKNDLRERFKLEPDIYVLQFIVDVLDINILIFNFEDLNINAVYHKDIMNPWKQTILLSKYKNIWEPIMLVRTKGHIERLFDYNDQFLKKMLQIDDLVKYYDGDNIKKKFISTTNIDDIVSVEKQKLKIIDTKIVIDENIFIEHDLPNELPIIQEIVETKKLNKTTLNKMKLAELQTKASELKLQSNAKMTKSMLIELILATN